MKKKHTLNQIIKPYTKMLIRVSVFFVLFIILELIYMKAMGQALHFSKLLFSFGYSVLFGLIASSFSKERYNNITFTFIGIIVITVYFTQMLYFNAFSHFGLVERFLRIKELLGVTNMVGSFFTPIFYLFIIPIAIILIGIFFLQRGKKQSQIPKKGILSGILAAVVLLMSMNSYYIYGKQDANKKVLQNSIEYVENYGVVDLLRKDIESHLPFSAKVEKTDPVVLREEFSVIPEENEQTSIYAGKNLVFVVAESLGTFGIDETITPTLFKLQQEGYNFNNYYSTKLNTFKSEYSMLTSFPLSATRESSPFTSEGTMPTLFKELGYQSLAFHNYQEDFYSRDVKHVELGFDAFYGSESLDINLFIDNPNFSIPQYIYPLDEELFEKSFPIYSEADQFFAYHLTVTGHGPYDIENRPNLQENYDAVMELFPNMTPEMATYYATAVETDRGIERMIADLEAENLLENTVIVLVGDHYPYGLSTDALDMLSENTSKLEDLSAYSVPFIVWDVSHPSQQIETTMSNVDILPTLANMFDLPLQYSFGKDVFSNQIDEIIVEWEDIASFSIMIQDGGYNAVDGYVIGTMTEEEIKNARNRSYARSRWNDDPYVLHGFRE